MYMYFFNHTSGSTCFLYIENKYFVNIYNIFCFTMSIIEGEGACFPILCELIR